MLGVGCVCVTKTVCSRSPTGSFPYTRVLREFLFWRHCALVSAGLPCLGLSGCGGRSVGPPRGRSRGAHVSWTALRAFPACGKKWRWVCLLPAKEAYVSVSAGPWGSQKPYMGIIWGCARVLCMAPGVEGLDLSWLQGSWFLPSSLIVTQTVLGLDSSRWPSNHAL